MSLTSKKLLAGTLAGYFTMECIIPYAQLPFRDFEPVGPELGECSLPIAHTANNVMAIFANIMGPEGMARDLYSDGLLNGLNDDELVSAYHAKEQKYNVLQYVRSTEEMPMIALDCYPTMISTVFAIAATETRSAFDGRMLDFEDYQESFQDLLPGRPQSEIDSIVYGLYLPLERKPL